VGCERVGDMMGRTQWGNIWNGHRARPRGGINLVKKKQKRQLPVPYTGAEDLPAMEEDQRNSVLDFRLPMNEMNVESPKVVNIDIRRELGHLIQFRFRLTPIIRLLPVLGEFLDIPLGIIDLVGEIAELEFLV